MTLGELFCSSNGTSGETEGMEMKDKKTVIAHRRDNDWSQSEVLDYTSIQSHTAHCAYLRCVLRLLLTWPWPVQPGVGHFSTFSCMARTRQQTQHNKLLAGCAAFRPEVLKGTGETFILASSLPSLLIRLACLAIRHIHTML